MREGVGEGRLSVRLRAFWSLMRRAEFKARGRTGAGVMDFYLDTAHVERAAVGTRGVRVPACDRGTGHPTHLLITFLGPTLG